MPPGGHAVPSELDAHDLSRALWHGVVLSARASRAPPPQQPEPGLAAVVYRRGLGLAACGGLVACRSHGGAPVWGQASASASAALCSLAAVAAAGSRSP